MGATKIRGLSTREISEYGIDPALKTNALLWIVAIQKKLAMAVPVSKICMGGGIITREVAICYV